MSEECITIGEQCLLHAEIVNILQNKLKITTRRHAGLSHKVGLAQSQCRGMGKGGAWTGKGHGQAGGKRRADRRGWKYSVRAVVVRGVRGSGPLCPGVQASQPRGRNAGLGPCQAPWLPPCPADVEKGCQRRAGGCSLAGMW